MMAYDSYAPCPKCGEPQVASVTGGHWACLKCGHEWNDDGSEYVSEDKQKEKAEAERRHQEYYRQEQAKETARQQSYYGSPQKYGVDPNLSPEHQHQSAPQGESTLAGQQPEWASTRQDLNKLQPERPVWKADDPNAQSSPQNRPEVSQAGTLPDWGASTAGTEPDSYRTSSAPTP